MDKDLARKKAQETVEAAKANEKKKKSAKKPAAEKKSTKKPAEEKKSVTKKAKSGQVSLANILKGNLEEKEPVKEAPVEEISPVEEITQAPVEENTSDESSVPKEKTAGELRTANFKTALQKNLTEILGSRLGKRLSDDVAYKLFKECFDSMVEFVRLEEENRLPLSGIGTFSIQMTKPRKAVNGESSELEKFEAIPHLKWKPSIRYKKYLFKKILGIEDEE